MVRRLALIFFAVILTGYSYGQSLSFEKYTHQLLFNIFTEQPDVSIQDFLKLYFPVLLDKKKKEGVWTGGTPKNFPEKGYEEIHSFIFAKHPFFKPTFSSGKIEFFCVRYADPNMIPQITNVKLWFEFDTQPEAEIAFSNLVETFIPISVNKKFSSVSGAQKAEFSDIKESKGFGKIRVRLTADNLDRRTFKILLETDNDL